MMRGQTMAVPRVVDQEFVVHCFAPFDGPDADQAYLGVRRLWQACREKLEMTERIAGLRAAPVLPPQPPAAAQ